MKIHNTNTTYAQTRFLHIRHRHNQYTECKLWRALNILLQTDEAVMCHLHKSECFMMYHCNKVAVCNLSNPDRCLKDDTSESAALPIVTNENLSVWDRLDGLDNSPWSKHTAWVHFSGREQTDTWLLSHQSCCINCPPACSVPFCLNTSA